MNTEPGRIGTSLLVLGVLFIIARLLKALILPYSATLTETPLWTTTIRDAVNWTATISDEPGE